MTTTGELIKKLKGLESILPAKGSATCGEAAQRLRELDKPDCVWTNDDKRVDSYITGCNKRQNLRWSPYCPFCQGAVKEAT